MGKIVVIGGVTPPSTLDIIDEEIIRLTNKECAKVLYIPAAGGDSLDYCERYRAIYEDKFNCKYDVLFLVLETPTESEIREKIFSSDIIYVGGGSPAKLMDCYRKFNLDNILKEAHEKGIVLAGISAGAICYGTNFFHQEDPSNFKFEGSIDYIEVICLKYIPFILWPHFNLDEYAEMFEAIIEKYNLPAIALDNNCALEFVDNSYRVVATKEEANAYKVYKKGDKIIKEVILKESNLRNLSELAIIP